MGQAEAPRIWLRSESKPGEARAALSRKMRRPWWERGFGVAVEDCEQRVFPTSAYRDAGCSVVARGSWQSAPTDYYILGLKELPAADFPLQHRHIYFAHAFKEQDGWIELLARFASGGGCLLDLEYLTDPDGRRLAAFGHWAASTAPHWACSTGPTAAPRCPGLPPLNGWADSEALVAECRAALAEHENSPLVIVVGAGGRVGGGALQLAQQLRWRPQPGISPRPGGGGPFQELLAYDILVNCVLVRDPLPPFITLAMIEADDRRWE